MNAFHRAAICFTVFLVSVVGLCEGAEQFSVTAPRVNVRAVPDPQGEIVGQIPQGTLLVGTGVRRDGWIEIQPPPQISVWLYGEMVRDGVVAAGSVRVRSGPGIGYRSVGTLTKGAKVETLDTKGDWLRIAPPLSCTVWINDEFVSAGGYVASSPSPAAPAAPVVAAPVARSEPPAPVVPSPAAPAAPQARPVATVAAPPETPLRPVVAPKTHSTPTQRRPPPKSVRTPPMPVNPLNRPATPPARQIVPVRPGLDEDAAYPAAAHVVSNTYPVKLPHAIRKLHLVSGAPQGVAIEVSGILRKTRFLSLWRPSRYRIVVGEGSLGPAKTGCYVIGDAAALAAHQDSSVTLVGRKYWAQGVREPVVLVSALRN